MITETSIVLNGLTGYQLVGVIGVILGNSNLILQGFNAINSTTLSVSVKNTANTDITANVRAYGLFFLRIRYYKLNNGCIKIYSTFL